MGLLVRHSLNGEASFATKTMKRESQSFLAGYTKAKSKMQALYCVICTRQLCTRVCIRTAYGFTFKTKICIHLEASQVEE